jgi:pyruvate formate lyase activating enzyme
VSAADLAAAAADRTACICYFGGDPTPQILHAIRTSQIALEKDPDRILRICFETNGSMTRGYLVEAVDLVLRSGGCIKFDLKAFDGNLHRALTGVDNRQTLENFRWVASRIPERPEPPPLIASSLLVPGYVESEEVRAIARFIASLDPSIPYSLLGFHPQFLMDDLPATSRDLALRCVEAAKDEGLERVHIGNLHLLW